MPIIPIIWVAGIAGTAAMTAFGWKAGDEVGEAVGDAVKIVAVAGVAYLAWKATQK